MSKIKFVLEDIEVSVDENETILEAGRRVGVFIESPCEGKGTCCKCKVKIQKGIENLKQMESPRTLTGEEIAQGYVLSCHTKVVGDVEVCTGINYEEEDSLKILSDGKTTDFEIKNHFVKKFDVDKTLVLVDNNVLLVEEGDTTDKMYGISVDIGTTTLVVALVDCYTGEEITSMSSLNPQCVYAQDVISRINYTTENEGGLLTMYKAVQDEINVILEKLCTQANVESKYIYEAVYSGNSTMLHLATNVDPYTLGQYPYTPKITGGNCINAKDNGLEISECGLIYLPMLISSFVGADITSGVLVCDLENIKGNTLFIDIGTNGEMIMASNGKLAATSTAAGPAFEGMNITFGMRACAGAIEYFEIDENFDIEIKTIDNKKPIGICGSGLFDITGELVRVGIITKSGKFVKKPDGISPKLFERLTKYNGKPAFLIAPDVYLTQLDIRQIQLAKSAIRAGVDALLSLLNISEQEVDKVIIAGSFGYYLRGKSIVNLGIIPNTLEEKIEFVGNTSKTGATAFLLSLDNRQKMESLVSKIEGVELSDYQGFEQLFVKHMTF